MSIVSDIGSQWTPEQILAFTWQDFAPYYKALNSIDLADLADDPQGLEEWLTAWSNLLLLQKEMENRLYISATQDTADLAASQAFEHFLDAVKLPCKSANQTMIEKLLQSRLEPQGFKLALHQLRTQAMLFNQQNLPLLNEAAMLASEYDKIAGSQTVQWQGDEKTVAEMQAFLLSPRRDEREAAWRASMERQMLDQEALNSLWNRLLDHRHRVAVNIGFTTYRDYRWLELTRFAYSPDDCLRFHHAIETTVVPAVSQLMADHRARLGVPSLRPWDLSVESLTSEPLHPFTTPQELEDGVGRMLAKVHPDFAERYAHMRAQNLLDLHNRNNKAPGGYTLDYPVSREAFSFLNCVGLPGDIESVTHEIGHCIHFYDTINAPYARYAQQLDAPVEFAEVAAMSMTLLTLPYWGKDQGGFYNEADHRIAEIQCLRGILTFLPFMSVVDLFQHWAYTHPDAARVGANCNRAWAELWQRFLPDADWSGMEDIRAAGWQRKIHIFSDPFYYIEYGLAQLGALQIWQHARRSPAGAVESYRRALARGGTEDLRTLYQLADTELIFDREPLQRLVDDVMERLHQLSTLTPGGIH